VFVLMLANGGARVGNRWFWFWMFSAHASGVSLAGQILYLLLERRPLWARHPRPVPLKPRYGGVAGFILTIPLAIALALTNGLLALLLN
jgi:hypothetical protein